ncbi:hypothetical protein ACFQZC_09130 [Streptacidiphilus monticola]
MYAAVGRTGTPQTVTDCPLRLDAGTGTDDLYVDLLVSPAGPPTAGSPD